VFKSFGSQVTVLEYFPEIIPRFDKDIAKRLKQSLSKRGIEIITSAKVEGVSSTADGLSVSYVRKDETLALCADKVLMAVGRRPALSSLDFASVGIETDRAVKVNSYMQTSVPSIYAIGDITGGWMLAHAATFQGLRALNHILAGQPSDGPVDRIRLDLVPAAVFTVPEVAVVGFSEEECKERGIAFKAHKSFFRANGKALAMGEPEGLCKILVSSGSEEYPAGEILGCHIMGAHAADLVQEVCTPMNSHGTIGDLGAVIHSHPTLSEVVLSAARG
jgi:dihydrolipoamide dehydrogenase